MILIISPAFSDVVSQGVSGVAEEPMEAGQRKREDFQGSGTTSGHGKVMVTSMASWVSWFFH